MSFPAYPAYRESGVPWLGRVPAHWNLTRLRFIAHFNPSKSEIGSLPPETEVSFLPMDAIGDDGSLRLDATRPLSAVEQGYTYFRDGDLLIAKITPCFENGKGALAAGLLGGIGFGTTELIVVRPLPGRAVAAYLQWLFVGPDFRNAGTAAMYGAGGQKRVPDEFVRNFVVAVPPPAEQRAIAAFLDRECGKIDALVAEQERLIALLKEKRQAVISHAVTKGLDPSAPMKDSGVPWLGQVPAHWEVKRLSLLFETISSGTTPDATDLEDGAGEVCWVTTGELRETVIFGTERRVSAQAVERLSALKVYPPGTLLIAMYGATIGRLGILGIEACTNQACCAFAHPRGVRMRFVFYALQSAQAALSLLASGGGQPNINQEKLRALRVAVPNEAEQSAIAVFLDRATGEIDTLTTEAERAIALLKERRAALISATVTGKIDVRGLVAAEEAQAA